MRWTARTALAGTAGVALVGAGVLAAANAATGTPQPSSSVVAHEATDGQVAALTQEAQALQDQVAGLQAAAAQLSAPAPVAAPAPRPDEETATPAPVAVATPNAPTAAHEPAEHPEHESEQEPQHDGAESDD